MDFHLSEDLASVQELARDIFTDKASVERVVAVEASDGRVDDALWSALSGAGLLSMPLPDNIGGDAMGLAGLAVVLIEQGRAVAPVPLWSSTIAAYAVARHGAPALVTEVAETVGAGARLALALEEFAGSPAEPRCVAAASGEDWTLSGVKAAVPSPAGATLVVVSAMIDISPAPSPEPNLHNSEVSVGGEAATFEQKLHNSEVSVGGEAALFLVDASAPGVTWERAETTSRDWAANLHLDAAPARRIGGRETVTWALQASACSLAALQLGIGVGALAITADYLKGRDQFGRSLGSFQAVQHQLADCWIDLDALRVTLWQAVSAFDEADSGAAHALGPDELARVVDVARYWAGQGGANLVHRTQHLHGGIGVDVDYPIHRYYLWGKQVANTLGGPQSALAALGDLLARTEVRS